MDFPDGLSTHALRALRHVAARACGPPLAPGPRITLNFHPDRLSGGLPILTSLARDGVYHSQFVTGTGNGGLTAHRGGDRWRWESRIFGGAYDDAEPAARPVYGALDFRRQVVGAAPRFGSSHLRLTARATARATFCYPDSAAEPTDFGVASALGLIALAEADERGRQAVGGEAGAEDVTGVPFREEGEVPGDRLHRGAAVARVHLKMLWHTLDREARRAPRGCGRRAEPAVPVR
ncbi:DUF3626 domain-containing protein [Streptomyces murinus]|uniref:DUF3626 domain-containing protein n=1 Tax=Streptomyces murinus TaxID=33900 RepID=UPI003F4D62C3